MNDCWTCDDCGETWPFINSDGESDDPAHLMDGRNLIGTYCDACYYLAEKHHQCQKCMRIVMSPVEPADNDWGQRLCSPCLDAMVREDYR